MAMHWRRRFVILTVSSTFLFLIYKWWVTTSLAHDDVCLISPNPILVNLTVQVSSYTKLNCLGSMFSRALTLRHCVFFGSDVDCP